MKKIIIILGCLVVPYSEIKACTDYDIDGEYFNLFTQSIIKDKSFVPFLLTYSNRFYDHIHYEVPNDNLLQWQKFFGGKLNYQEVKTLVFNVTNEELHTYKKGNTAHAVLAKLGSYAQYAEAIDYLMKAKELEPYMRISLGNSSDDIYYYSEFEKAQTVDELNKESVIQELKERYYSVRNPEIKLRYAYQIVRFLHYKRAHQESVQAFEELVQPLKQKSAIYYLALDQYAGALSGLNRKAEANAAFFQVFIHSNHRRDNAFLSMKMTSEEDFNTLLEGAKSNEEKAMAYFLLGYDSFSNPMAQLDNIYNIDPNSELIKVLVARAVNELERSYLPAYYYSDEWKEGGQSEKGTKETSTTAENKEEIGFFGRIWNFFKGFFSSKKDTTGKPEKRSDKELMNHPNRLPVKQVEGKIEEKYNYISDLKDFVSKQTKKSDDAYWEIVEAYIYFLQKDYKESMAVLAAIKTDNTEYKEQIQRMQMVNEIVGQPKIDADFEELLIKKYPELFVEEKSDQENDYLYSHNSTADFVRDILANRYYLQGEYGKSFLMANPLSNLQYSLEAELVKSLQAFYKKKNKTQFEEDVLAKKIDISGDVDAFFNVIFGDLEMKAGNFAQAKQFYQKSKNFTGIPRMEYIYNEKTDQYTQEKKTYEGQQYDGFHHISSLVFGHNVWESYGSPEHESMKAEGFNFPFIRNRMTKLELADALVQLEKIGKGSGVEASQANQLIGNVMYNTSILGYYRHLFVLDIDNSQGGKYHFIDVKNRKANQYYYKNFTLDQGNIPQDNFDIAIRYYQKALKHAQNDEQKARILFQMASAEQGKYYQWEATQHFKADYDDPNWSKKNEAFLQSLTDKKYTEYKTYFTTMKKDFSHTKVVDELRSSCSYFDSFMQK